jgi:hypothetical protein
MTHAFPVAMVDNVGMMDAAATVVFVAEGKPAMTVNAAMAMAPPNAQAQANRTCVRQLKINLMNSLRTPSRIQSCVTSWKTLPFVGQ